MLHFTCDLCGEKVDDTRFVVRLELYPAFDPEAISEADLEQDNLEEISELLAEMELTGELNLDDCGPKTFRYDLCRDCCREYQKDPLALHRPRRMRFSEN